MPRSYDQSAKESYRVTFNLPEVVGGYATETIVFGPTPPGTQVWGFREITALVEGPIANGTLELWLPKVPAGPNAVLPENRTVADYFNSGITPITTSVAGRWQLSAWPGAMLRMKSGSVVPASVTVSACGF